MINGAKQPEISPDEMLYRGVEQLAMIADLAVNMVQHFAHEAQSKEAATPEQIAESSARTAQNMQLILQAGQHMNTAAVLSRLVVLIASAAKTKSLCGAQLTFSKQMRTINLKTFYAPGENDFYNMVLTPEIAEQLRDGLTEALDKVAPKPKLIMPDTKIIQ